MKIPQFYNLAKNFLWENRSVRQTLMKNSAWLFFSEFITRSFTIVLAIFVARRFGAENYGLLTFAIALTGLFAVLADFGFQSIVIREMGQRKEAKEELKTILFFKIILAIAVFSIIFLSARFVGDPVGREIVIVFGVITSISAVYTLFIAVFQSFQKMQYVAICEISKAFILFLGGFLVIFFRPEIRLIAYAYLVSSVLAFLIALGIMKRLSVLSFPVFNAAVLKKYFSFAWPLALSGIFTIIYVQIDSVMMGFWGMITQVGWYQAACRMTNFIIFPAAIIGNVFYPIVVQAFKKEREYFQKIIDNFFRVLVIFGLPIVVGGLLLSKRIIIFFYSQEYSSSVLAFQILIPTVGIIFIFILINALLVTIGQQKKIFYITGSTALLNVVLNFLLIPRYSLYGAAISTLICYVFLFLFGFIFLKRAGIAMFSTARILFLPVLAVTIMAAFICSGIMRDVNVIAQVLSAGFLYFLIIFAAVLFKKKLSV